MFKIGDKVVIKQGVRVTGGGPDYRSFCDKHSKLGTIFEVSNNSWAVFFNGYDYCWDPLDLQLASIELENK